MGENGEREEFGKLPAASGRLPLFRLRSLSSAQIAAASTILPCIAAVAGCLLLLQKEISKLEREIAEQGRQLDALKQENVALQRRSMVLKKHSSFRRCASVITHELQEVCWGIILLGCRAVWSR